MMVELLIANFLVYKSTKSTIFLYKSSGVMQTPSVTAIHLYCVHEGSYTL